MSSRSLAESLASRGRFFAPGDLQLEGPPISREFYALLAEATPAERLMHLRAWIAEHSEGRLELAAIDGVSAILDDVDLSSLATLDLNKADLRGVRLRRAKLAGVDLSGADLRGASLGKADLRRAKLDESDLRDADLEGADLRRASMAAADCRGAMLEEADLRGAGLRFAKLQESVLEGAKLAKADLWGATLADAIAPMADFRGATLKEADLHGADLVEANFRGAILGKAAFVGAKLRGADLRRAAVGGTDFRDADLRDARLQGLDLTGSLISRVKLSGASLDRSRFGQGQIGAAIGEELAGDYDEARKAYLALERFFQELGDTDAASWAYRRKRRMQKLDALVRAKGARSAREWGHALNAYAGYASDQVVEWICDYGESLTRILYTMLLVYAFFTLIYGLTGGVTRVDPATPGVSVPVRDPVNLAIFSFMAMTASNPPNGMEPASTLMYLLTGIQTLIGVALTGLLGFVMGNLVRR
jgi:uncharacterized protein YjbI with pentapeptide repeats